MQPYVKLYMTSLDYVIDDFVPSELSGHRCVDVHHIEARGMGGTGDYDRIENLMGLTRSEHIKYGDKEQYMVFLYENHRSFLKANGVLFSEEYFEQKIKQYS